MTCFETPWWKANEGFQKWLGVPQARWLVDFRENPHLEMDDDYRGTLISGNLHMKAPGFVGVEVQLEIEGRILRRKKAWNG